jgi:hypothetical protein
MTTNFNSMTAKESALLAAEQCEMNAQHLAYSCHVADNDKAQDLRIEAARLRAKAATL